MRLFILILLILCKNIYAEETVIYGDEINQEFGSSIDTFGDLLIVGSNEGFAEIFEKNLSSSYSANYAVLSVPNKLTVYLYQRNGNTWNQIKKITQPNHYYFGSSIEINDSLLVIGANLDSSFGTYDGSAFIYRRNGSAWNFEGQIWAYDYNEISQIRFGSSVTFANDLLVIGSNKGAYPFYKIGPFWIPEPKIEMNSNDEEL